MSKSVQLLYELSLLVPAANILNNELRKLYQLGAHDIPTQKTSIETVKNILGKVMKAAYYYKHLHLEATDVTLNIIKSVEHNASSYSMVAIALITRHSEINGKMIILGVNSLLNDFYDLMLDHEYDENTVKISEELTDNIVEKLQMHYFKKIKYELHKGVA
ncbi:MAG: hypothetical protein IE909_11090 [Campylobacterales bacterium]|nr:hypothetical protein [Campylobacterales bacterium]